MINKYDTELSRVLYLPHGGGPLPLLGDNQHEALINFLTNIGSKLGTPSAILIISAHWEEEQVTITSASHPELIYDYYGFPPESYSIKYPAPSHPQLANDIHERMAAAGINSILDERRGFDHGMFVPLKLIFPEANIPCVQISLVRGLDPETHIKIGRTLALLRKQNVLILGSGLSFHNTQAFMSSSMGVDEKSDQFNDWLIETCTSQALSTEECEQRLTRWEDAPHARYCHPREEHLIPLHVCFGAAADDSKAELVFHANLMGRKPVGLLW